MNQFDYLGNSEVKAIEKLYQNYKQNKTTVDESWRRFFEGFEFANTDFSPKSANKLVFDKEFKVINLIHAYRQRGHLFTRTNPVRRRRTYKPTLDLENFGLSTNDLETTFQAGSKIGIGAAKLNDIVKHLQQTYCQSIGVEYRYIAQPEKVEWLQTRMESNRNTPDFTPDTKKTIYYQLMQAVNFEKFIHKKFMGQKRFSLEGAESLIPTLHAVINRGAMLGIHEFNIAMPHRGRLNVLANILQKPYEHIFNEYLSKEYDDDISLGDVKYHLGYDNTITTEDGKKIALKLIPNPSHLETAGSVLQGLARARIENKYANDYSKVAPIIIHGDAAISSQGIVYEIIQMSELKGYKTGGTIHLIINNQIGFTTNYINGRTSTYCTDIAKVTKSPVFHVNGDDVEALILTIRLAVEYRQHFGTDVFIDILCYRRYGHNEGDEPRFTQPLLYKAIAQHPDPCSIYAKQLTDKQIFTQDDLKTAKDDFNEILENKFEKAKSIKKVQIKPFMQDIWSKYKHSDDKDTENSKETAVKKNQLLSIAKEINALPEDVKFFRKIARIFDERKRMIKNDKLDWAIGEHLAYGSLLNQNIPVRISGQDCERGTFSHRHAALTIDESEEKYYPLKHVSENQASFSIYNSPLSEYGILGFEYGYALGRPEGLTIWEAQFGDFHNVAQAIVDQYISSAEEKWGLKNGLVLYLPHGFEGQGPEHSSARVERWLTLAARNNIQIVNCTTPANLFHVLRRQVLSNYRTPLIIFTPKSLLRHPECVSPIRDFSAGNFHEVIDDPDVIEDEVKRVVYCSGKIYYDLLKKKKEFDAKDVALIRIEQLHPFPLERVRAIKNRYENTLLSIWVQEEPRNMGAWHYFHHQFPDIQLEPVTRLSSGSPAVGLSKIHALEQEEIIRKIFRRCTCEFNYKYCGLQCVVGKSHEEILKQHRYL